MTLTEYLEKKGYDSETIKHILKLWENDLPIPEKIEKDILEWWNDHSI